MKNTKHNPYKRELEKLAQKLESPEDLSYLDELPDDTSKYVFPSPYSENPLLGERRDLETSPKDPCSENTPIMPFPYGSENCPTSQK